MRAHASTVSEVSQDLAEAAWQSMAQRSMPGLAGYPLALLCLGIASPNAIWLPWATWLATLILTAARCALVFRFERLYAKNPRLWKVSFGATFLGLSGLVAGTVYRVIVASHFAPSSIFALCVAVALMAIGANIYAQSLLLSRLFISLVAMICLVGLWEASTPAIWRTTYVAGIAMAAYALYLAALGRQLHDERWRNLETNSLLRLRAAELETAQAELRQAHGHLEDLVVERTEELRHVSEDLWRIFEGAHDAIVVFAPEDERILNANRRACELYGYAREELLGMSLVEVSDDALRGREHIELTLNKGVYHNFQTSQFRKDGTRMFLEINASVIEYEGRPAILSINRDVTDRRQSEELRLAKEAAERTGRAKTQFLANMSHEIRTPMSGIIGLTDLLLKSGLQGETRDYAGLIQSSAGSLLRLIDDILDFSKIEEGKLELERAPFHLPRLLREVGDLLRFRAQEKGIALDLVIAESVPEWLNGDSGRVRQVLLNVIGNAVKFTDRGQVEVEVWRDDDRVVFEVRDTGIGIPLEAHGRLFSLFSQADTSTTRRFGGTGLGLAISKRLVEQMGGEIGFESAPGKGSTFWIRLAFETASPPAAARPQRVRGVAAPERCRILVAEDNPINQLVVIRQLEAFGYNVTGVANGREALAALDATPFDLVLMDCQMPEMDGYEATRCIRQRDREGRRLPVIALTAHAFREDLDRCLAAGMDDYITKPFQPETLHETLEVWLAGGGGEGRLGQPAAPPLQRLDRSRIEALRELERRSGQPLLPRLFESFRDGTLMSDLRVSLQAGDLAALERQAHSLKGSSGTLGGARLAALAGELELAAREAVVDSYVPLVDRVEGEYRLFLAELSSEVDSAAFEVRSAEGAG